MIIRPPEPARHHTFTVIAVQILSTLWLFGVIKMAPTPPTLTFDCPAPMAQAVP